MSSPLNPLELAALRAFEPTLARKLAEVAPRGVQVWYNPTPTPASHGYTWTVTLFTGELGEVVGRGNTLSAALALAIGGL